MNSKNSCSRFNILESQRIINSISNNNKIRTIGPQHFLLSKIETNEAPSDVNKALDDSTYPRWKMFHFLRTKNYFWALKCTKLTFGTGSAADTASLLYMSALNDFLNLNHMSFWYLWQCYSTADTDKCSCCYWSLGDAKI